MSKKFKTAERLLYTYPLNVMRLREARYSLWRLRLETDCHAQRYEASCAGAGTHSDPPGQYVQQITVLEEREAEYLQATETIRDIRYRLGRSCEKVDAQKLSVMELHYFERRTLKQLAFHLQMSERTVFRRRDELIGQVIDEMKL